MEHRPLSLFVDDNRRSKNEMDGHPRHFVGSAPDGQFPSKGGILLANLEGRRRLQMVFHTTGSLSWNFEKSFGMGSIQFGVY